MADGVGANIGTSINNGSLISTQALAGTVPGTSALGTTAPLVSVDALEEFKIQTSAYSAEYGRQPGGQVQLVTRSGKSQFNGSLFEYVRNEKFDANDFFRNATGRGRAPLRQNLFGGTLGGPLYLPNFSEGGPVFSSDKKPFFFFSYEGLRLLLPDPNVTTNFVPSLRLRQIASPFYQPILNAFPLPTGPELTNAAGAPNGVAPFVGSFSNPSSSDAYSIRLDRQLTNKMTLFGRYSDIGRIGASNRLPVRSKKRLKKAWTIKASCKSFTPEMPFTTKTRTGT